MSYDKRVTLRCDGDGCLEWYEHDTGKATDAREYAKRAGWTYRDGNDYCEDCK